jgi:septum site-determining protein MinD
MGKAVLIASGKGGTGKTAATAALGSYLALYGQRTICIDADPLGGLDLALGVSEQTVFDLSDVLAGHCKMTDALIPVRNDEAVISSYRFAKLGGGAVQDPVGFRLLINAIKQHCDWLIIDAGAGRSAFGDADSESKEDAQSSEIDVLVLIVNPDRASWRSASIIREQSGIPAQYMIMNRVRERIMKRVRATIDDAIDAVGTRLIGYIPEDEAIMLASAKGVPTAFYKRQSELSKGQQAFRESAFRLRRITANN